MKKLLNSSSIKIILLIGGAFLTALLLNAVFFPFFDMLNGTVNDSLFRLRHKIKGREEHYPGLLHIDLNDDDLKKIDLPFWDRSKFGEMVDVLTQAEAGLIGFDISFEHKGLPAGDRQFVEALERAENVYLPVALNPENPHSTPGETGIPAFGWGPEIVKKNGKPFSGKIIHNSFTELREKARGIGHINYTSGLDGVIRRFPLLLRSGEGYVPSLSLQLICDYLGTGEIEVSFGKEILLKNAGFPGKNPQDLRIPIDNKGRILINWEGPWFEKDTPFTENSSMTNYSFSGILSLAGSINFLKNKFRGSLVLISDNTTRSKDFTRGVFDPVYPLSGVHVNIINSILTENFIHPPPAVEKIIIILFLIAVMLLFTHLFQYKGFLFSVFFSYLLFIGYSSLLFIYQNHSADVILPTTGCLLSLFSVSIYYFLQERKKRILLEVEVEANKKIESLNSQLIVQKEALEEKDRYKTRFIQNMTHEFRTPLTLILGPVEYILSGDNELPEEVRKSLSIINRNGVRLLYLVNQLLDLSKLGSGKERLRASAGNIIPFLHKIVADYNKMAEPRRVVFKLISRAQEQLLYFDHEKMEKIIHNLLINALKFSPAHGEVIISVSDLREADKCMNIPRGKNIQRALRIRISDNGAGIPVNKLPFIFDRFYQTDDRGAGPFGSTGIGLSLVKEYVELHYGGISVSSEEGKGSEFNLFLPLGRGHLADGEFFKNISPDNPDNPSGIFVDYAGGHILNSRKTAPLNRGITGKRDPAMNGRILVVEDEPDMRVFLRNILKENYEVLEAENGKTGMEAAVSMAPDLIISDFMMPEMDGSEFFMALKKKTATRKIPVIFLTVKAFKDAALQKINIEPDDYLSKPFNRSELLKRVSNILKIKELNQRVCRYKKKLEILEPDHPEYFSHIKTGALCMKKVFKTVETVAGIPEPVLITGESGSGKELLASAIHQASRLGGKYVTVNIAGVDDQMFSDTLFGHKSGAFTGASKGRQGLIVEARNGSLFFDEIGDLEKRSQVKLLRLLDNREYLSLGSDTLQTSNARIIAATNADLAKKQEAGEFRLDLYSRFTYKIRIPPLRERPEDIPVLMDYFLEEASGRSGIPIPVVPGELITLLRNYTFPGNIRDLRNMVYLAICRHKKNVLSLSAFREYISAHPGQKNVSNLYANHGDSINISLKEGILTLKELERCYIQDVLTRVNGSQTIAANYLGLSSATISRKIKKLGIK